MPKPVAVFNVPPVYAVGLADALVGTDYSLEEVVDLDPWLKRHRGAAVLVGVHSLDDLDVVLELKAEAPDTVVLTLLDRVSVETVLASLRAGAAGSIALYAKADDTVLAIRAAMADKTLLPTTVAQTMARGAQAGTNPSMLSDAEVVWLRALASGETVADLGERVGYSERVMYRRLHRLYARMGAAGRIEALLLGARWGLLDE